MLHGTLLRAIAKHTCIDLVALDNRIFAEDELAALSRGWRVTHPAPFCRAYRDERWDQVGIEPIPPSPGRSS